MTTPKLIDVKSIHPSKSSQPRGPLRAHSTGESKNGGGGGVGYAATAAINDGLELLIFAVLSKRDRLTSGNRRHRPIY